MTEESLSQPTCPYRVTHALNNNAVAAVDIDSDTPVILVGKGLGFGRRPGDEIRDEHIQERYIALGEDRFHYFDLLRSIPPATLEAISGGLELAEEQLGTLHPSVYVVLTDHLAFALQRLADGQMIANPLLPEIQARFPREFIAAEILLRHVNARLGLDLPDDEAAFITLHLRAACTGATVKQPLSQANALAALTEEVVRCLLRVEPSAIDTASRQSLVSYLARLADRIVRGAARTNAAKTTIRRDLPFEFEMAESVVDAIASTNGKKTAECCDEAVYTAVFFHGWLQDAASRHP